MPRRPKGDGYSHLPTGGTGGGLAAKVQAAAPESAAAGWAAMECLASLLSV